MFNGNNDVVFVFGGNNDIFYWVVVVVIFNLGVMFVIVIVQVQQVVIDLVGYIKDMISKNVMQFYVFNLFDSSLMLQGVVGGVIGQVLLYVLVGVFNIML